MAGVPRPRVLFSEGPGNRPLAHVPGSLVVRADKRTDLLERRAEVLQASNYVTQRPAAVGRNYKRWLMDEGGSQAVSGRSTHISG